MIEVEASTFIDAPPEKVWEYMSDLGKMTEWDPGTLKVEWQPPVKVGSVAVLTVQLLGRRRVKEEITEWEPNRKLGFRGESGGSVVRAVYTIEPAEGNKTKLSRSATLKIGGWPRLISPLVARKAKNERLAEVENIKRIVEGHQKK